MNIILSIDPGLEKTGYALFKKNQNKTNRFEFITSGLLKTDRSLSKERRLKLIYDNLLILVNKYKPNILVFEDIFFFKNQKTVISVAQAQGLIYLISAQSNLKLISYSPLQIKQAVTGYGLSDKKAIKKMICLSLKLPKENIEDDEYDAIACGLSYCFQNDKLIK